MSNATEHCVYDLDLSGSLQGAGTIGGLLATLRSGDSEPVEGFYAYDANGNVTELADKNGVVVTHYEYDPCGSLSTMTGTAATANPFRFSTKHLDGETEMYYYGFRFLLPEIGRWVSRDPYGKNGGLNAYTPCNNNLTSRIDGLGLFECRSEGFQGVDPLWPGTISYGYGSGNASSCSAFLTHSATAMWWGPFSTVAICNSGAGQDNTHLKIQAKSPCCRWFSVTCTFSYNASVGNTHPGPPSRPMGGIQLPVFILDESPHWHETVHPDGAGIWGASLMVAMSITRSIQIGPAWKTLLDSAPVVASGTRMGSDEGAWLGAEFTEAFVGSCSLMDIGPCSN